MALIQITTASSGGGGGGTTITGWEVEEFTQTTNFISGGVILTLAQTPLFPGSIDADYNGQTIYLTTSFSVSGNQITILFDDPYVTSYDEPPIFHVRYPY